MADQFDERADEWMRRLFVLEDSGDPKHPVKGRIDYRAKQDVEKEIAAALRSVNTTAEARGFARGVEAAAVHGKRGKDADSDLAHEILALIPADQQEPKIDTRTDVEIEQRMDELFESD